MITVTCGGRRNALSEGIVQSTVDVTTVIIAAAAAPAVQSTLAGTEVSALGQALGVPIISMASPILARAYAYPAPPPTMLSTVSAGNTASDAGSSAGLVIGIVFGLVGLVLVTIAVVLLQRYIARRGTSTVVKAVAVDAGAIDQKSAAGTEMMEGPDESKI